MFLLYGSAYHRHHTGLTPVSPTVRSSDVQAGVLGCAIGPGFDAALAAEAHRLGAGAPFDARFNRDEPTVFSEPVTAAGKVGALSDGKFVGRHGMEIGRAHV